MIAIRIPTPTAPRLVEALLVAGGAIPAPTDPTERQAYLDLAHGLGNGLDTLPHPNTRKDPQ